MSNLHISQNCAELIKNGGSQNLCLTPGVFQTGGCEVMGRCF